MKTLGLLTAAVVAAATLTTAPLIGAAPGTNRSVVSQVRSLRHGIEWHRTMTWHYQDELGVRRTISAHAERRTRSVAFLRWIDQLWSHRRIRAKHALSANRLPLTNDWTTAVRIVQRDWPGTATWMLNCSSGEGSHGVWIWNGSHPYSSPDHGSGAGGWMQYLDTTFASQYASALARARMSHLPVPPPGANLPRAGVWRESPIAQAFAAGWARLYTDSHSTWDPGIDSNCY